MGMMLVVDLKDVYFFMEIYDLVGGFWDLIDGDMDLV